jgi:hypothetical protein
MCYAELVIEQPTVGSISWGAGQYGKFLAKLAWGAALFTSDCLQGTAFRSGARLSGTAVLRLRMFEGFLIQKEV